MHYNCCYVVFPVEHDRSLSLVWLSWCSCFYILSFFWFRLCYSSAFDLFCFWLVAHQPWSQQGLSLGFSIQFILLQGLKCQ